MADFYFFVDPADIDDSDPNPIPFGPVTDEVQNINLFSSALSFLYYAIDTATDDVFNLTSYHKVKLNTKAYAVCKSHIFVQEVNSDWVNIILFPIERPSFDHINVKYIIYRGIKKGSLLDEGSEGKDVISALSSQVGGELWKQHEELVNKGVKVNAPDEDTIGLTINDSSKPGTTASFTLNDDEPIMKAFYPSSWPMQLPVVEGGTHIGDFIGEYTPAGIEIVVDNLQKEPTMQEVRSQTNFFELPKLTGSPTEVQFQNDLEERQKILNYVDPASFFNSFGGESDDLYNPKTKVKMDHSVFSKKFHFRYRVYIDIRDSLDQYFNTYKTYGEGVLVNMLYNEVKYSIDSVDFATLMDNIRTGNTSNYHTLIGRYRGDDSQLLLKGGVWPIIILDELDLRLASGAAKAALPSGSGIFGGSSTLPQSHYPIYLVLPTPDAVDSIIYRPRGARQTSSYNTVVRSRFVNSTENETFTGTKSFSVPVGGLKFELTNYPSIASSYRYPVNSYLKVNLGYRKNTDSTETVPGFFHPNKEFPLDGQIPLNKIELPFRQDSSSGKITNRVYNTGTVFTTSSIDFEETNHPCLVGFAEDDLNFTFYTYALDEGEGFTEDAPSPYGFNTLNKITNSDYIFSLTENSFYVDLIKTSSKDFVTEGSTTDIPFLSFALDPSFKDQMGQSIDPRYFHCINISKTQFENIKTSISNESFLPNTAVFFGTKDDSYGGDSKINYRVRKLQLVVRGLIEDPGNPGNLTIKEIDTGIRLNAFLND